MRTKPWPQVMGKNKTGAKIVGVFAIWLLLAYPFALAIEQLVKGSDAEFALSFVLGLGYLFLPPVVITLLDP